MDVQRYLQRLGLAEAPALTREGLDQLIYAHQTHVPFEDLDVYEQGKEISLDLDDLFEKVVVRKRGGYCYELNSLFCALLQELGFDAHNILCRAGFQGHYDRLNHLASLVTIDGMPHFADVGYGGPMPGYSIPLDGQRHSWQDETFWATLDEADGWYWLTRLRHAGDEAAGEPPVEGDQVLEHTPIKFSLEQPTAEEVAPLNFNAYGAEGARFRGVRLVNLRTATGHVDITGDVFSVKENGVKRSQPVEDNLNQLLSDYFGIEM